MLPKTADEALLEDLFAPYGKIKEIHIIRTVEVRVRVMDAVYVHV